MGTPTGKLGITGRVCCLWFVKFTPEIESDYKLLLPHGLLLGMLSQELGPQPRRGGGESYFPPGSCERKDTYPPRQRSGS